MPSPHYTAFGWGLNEPTDAKVQSQPFRRCEYPHFSAITVQTGNLISTGHTLKMATHPGVKCGTEKINHTPWIGILPPSSGKDRGSGNARFQMLRWTFSFDLGQRMALILLLKSPAHKMLSFPWRKKQSLEFKSGRKSLNPFSMPGTVVVQLSCVRLFVTPWTAAHQASLSFTISWNLLKIMSIESVMSSNHLILCCPLLLLPSIFPNIRVFSNKSALHTGG